MRSLLPSAVLAGAALLLTAASPAGRQAAETMSFFITSVGSGDGANLGGLAGADRHCHTLAEAAGVRGKEWRAYLSATARDGRPAVHARDRIGAGPWHNAKGVLIATDLEQLHSEASLAGKANSLNERGEPVNGRGDSPNMHDILTGSNPDGTLAVDTLDTTCGDWTSSAPTGRAMVGHHDRTGGGARPTSWNSAHPSRGCGQANLVSTGGNGLFYCFAK